MKSCATARFFVFTQRLFDHCLLVHLRHKSSCECETINTDKYSNTMPPVIHSTHILAEISGWFPWSRSVMLGFTESEQHSLRQSAMKLFFKYFNLCDQDTSTSQTDGRLAVAVLRSA